MNKLRNIAIGTLALKSVAGMGQVEQPEVFTTTTFENNVPKINLVGAAQGKVSLGFGPFKPWASFGVKSSFKPSDHHFTEFDPGAVNNPEGDSIITSSSFPPQKTTSFGVGADFDLNPNMTLTAGIHSSLTKEQKKILVQAGIKHGLKLSNRASLEAYGGIFFDRSFFNLTGPKNDLTHIVGRTGLEVGGGIKYKVLRDLELSANVGLQQALTTNTDGIRPSGTEAMIQLGVNYILPLRKSEFDFDMDRGRTPRQQKVKRPTRARVKDVCPAHRGVRPNINDYLFNSRR